MSTPPTPAQLAAADAWLATLSVDSLAALPFFEAPPPPPPPPARERVSPAKPRRRDALDVVTIDRVRALQHLPLKAAAAHLGVGTTNFKLACRALGVRAWPCRRLRFVATLRARVATQRALAARAGDAEAEARLADWAARVDRVRARAPRPRAPAPPRFKKRCTSLQTARHCTALTRRALTRHAGPHPRRPRPRRGPPGHRSRRSRRLPPETTHLVCEARRNRGEKRLLVLVPETLKTSPFS